VGKPRIISARNDSPTETILQVLGTIGDAPSPRRQLSDAVLGRLQQVVSFLVVHFKVPLVGAQPQRHLLQPHCGIEASVRFLVPRCFCVFFVRIWRHYLFWCLCWILVAPLILVRVWIVLSGRARRAINRRYGLIAVSRDRSVPQQHRNIRDAYLISGDVADWFR